MDLDPHKGELMSFILLSELFFVWRCYSSERVDTFFVSFAELQLQKKVLLKCLMCVLALLQFSIVTTFFFRRAFCKKKVLSKYVFTGTIAL